MGYLTADEVRRLASACANSTGSTFRLVGGI
jgi:hypothetical protein